MLADCVARTCEPPNPSLEAGASLSDLTDTDWLGIDPRLEAEASL